MRGVVAFLALVLAAPLHAADLSVDEARVYACHAATPEGYRSPDCLGAASDQCQLLPEGATTQGIAICIAAETAIWDDILNREYQITRADLKTRDASEGTDLAGGLQKAQRAWIAFRDAECDLTYDQWEGGSVRGIAYANCLLVMTAERSIVLRDMRPR